MRLNSLWTPEHQHVVTLELPWVIQNYHVLGRAMRDLRP